MQFNLTTQLEAHEILNDAYLRGREFIQSGGTIRNPHAWLKSTSLNIIREKSRRQKKEHPIAPEQVEQIPCLRVVGDGAVTSEDTDKNLRVLWSSFKVLSNRDPEGAKLLRLQAEGLSWKEIHEHLVKEDGKAPSESALRQRACRAKKNLRRIYHSKTTDAADLRIS